MPFNLSPIEVIMILAVILIVFGVGRISKVSRELGSSVREFRKGMKGDENGEADNSGEKPKEEAEAPK